MGRRLDKGKVYTMSIGVHVPNLFVRTENEIFEETNYLFLAGSILQIETKHFALGHKLRAIATFLSFSNVIVQAASQNQQKTE